MPVSEFNLIDQYFKRSLKNQTVNRLGIGDDCALMHVPDGHELAVTTDTMVEGVHFFAGVDAESLGYKLLAVNLSDLAAMSAKPVSVSLALTLPEVNESWLRDFSAGFFQLAEQFAVDLIGGDTTAGPLTLSVQAMGLVLKDEAVRRSGARQGDLIFVTGNLGDAGLGFKIVSGYTGIESTNAVAHFHRPQPRVKEGLAIRHYANACIDLSDGIASDLKHILKHSQVGATLDWELLPISPDTQEYIQQTGDWQLPLVAGEDYQLCFTVSPEKLDLIDIECTKIGVVQQQPGLRLSRNGRIEPIEVKGFEHFSK